MLSKFFRHPVEMQFQFKRWSNWFDKFYSLPRPKEKRHKVHELSYKLDFDPLQRQLKRAKSLEQILDSGKN